MLVTLPLQTGSKEWTRSWAALYNFKVITQWPTSSNKTLLPEGSFLAFSDSTTIWIPSAQHTSLITEAFYLLTSALFYPSMRRCFQRRRGLEGWVRVSQQQSNLERRKCLVTRYFRIKVNGKTAVRERAKRHGRCWTAHTKKGTAAAGTQNAALWDTRRSWNYSPCMEDIRELCMKRWSNALLFILAGLLQEEKHWQCHIRLLLSQFSRL